MGGHLLLEVHHHYVAFLLVPFQNLRLSSLVKPLNYCYFWKVISSCNWIKFLPFLLVLFADVNIESPPSMHPGKRICDITGFEVYISLENMWLLLIPSVSWACVISLLRSGCSTMMVPWIPNNYQTHVPIIPACLYSHVQSRG